VPNQDDLSSIVVGLDIYNNSNQDVGQIKDIALGPNGRSQAYIVSVGGFLGMGEHYVAVNPSAVKVSYNTADKKWHAAMNTSADQLKAAPEFKYAGRWEANRG
jgi:sporulation protein YlmC with PRC-barrel domain